MTQRTPVIFGSLLAIIIVAVLFLLLYKAKTQEHALRIQKETELAAKVAELGQKEAELLNLTEQKRALEEEMTKKIEAMESSIQAHEEQSAVLSQKVETLKMEKEELEKDAIEKEKTIAELTKKIHVLEMDKLDLVSSIRGLEQSTSSASEGDGAGQSADTVRLGQIVVQKDMSSAVRVEHVNDIYGFVVINAGTKEGLKKDSVVSIVRNNRIIGKAVVQKPRDHVSAAAILPEWTVEQVKPGDWVSLN